MFSSKYSLGCYWYLKYDNSPLSRNGLVLASLAPPHKMPVVLRRHSDNNTLSTCISQGRTFRQICHSETYLEERAKKPVRSYFWLTSSSPPSWEGKRDWRIECPGTDLPFIRGASRWRNLSSTPELMHVWSEPTLQHPFSLEQAAKI